MFRRAFIGAALAASITIPVHAQEPQEPHAHWCMLAKFQVTQVGSLYTTLPSGRGLIKRFSGAQVFVPAEPGLTAEWIQANLARHVAEPSTHRSFDCPLDIAGVSMKVVSGGTGFWIQISAKDGETAKEILDRARQLVR